MKKFFSFAVAVILCLSLFSCSGAKRFSVTYTDLFDTVSTFTAYCSGEGEFKRISSLVYDRLKEYHLLFDSYSCYEGVVNVCLMNRHERDIYEVDPVLSELISMSKTLCIASNFAFNPALGNLTFLWRGYREGGTAIPSESEIIGALKNTDFMSVQIDNNSVTFENPYVKLDFGAVAKGYAAQKCKEYVSALGFKNFALNLGGNVVTDGKKPEGSWEIGIQDPKGGLVTTVSVSGMCVVTSGDYQRFYTVDGVSYHHIIDPNTGYPSVKHHSVTVIADNSAVADALSTALFCMSVEEGKELAALYQSEALWITENGEIYRTDGFSDYEK